MGDFSPHFLLELVRIGSNTLTLDVMGWQVFIRRDLGTKVHFISKRRREQREGSKGRRGASRWLESRDDGGRKRCNQGRKMKEDKLQGKRRMIFVIWRAMSNWRVNKFHWNYFLRKKQF